MLGKPVTPPSEDAAGIPAALARLSSRIGELHEQLSYLEEATRTISLPAPAGCNNEAPNAVSPVKSDIRAIIDEYASSVQFAMERVMRVRCDLDL